MGARRSPGSLGRYCGGSRKWMSIVQFANHQSGGVQRVDSQTREEFFEQLSDEGKFANTVGIYRHNSSADRIGIFDKELIDKLPSTVKWIAHNGKLVTILVYDKWIKTVSGAGYDQIDVYAAKDKGQRGVLFFRFD